MVCTPIFRPKLYLMPTPQSESSTRVVNTLLTELDGLDSRKSVYVIAATNRPDMIDPAMVRPGRLDKLLYVDLPSADERVEIVRTLVRKTILQCAEHIVRDKCDGYSGADLAAVVREAGVIALKRVLGALDQMDESGGLVEDRPRVLVVLEDFMRAQDKVGPSRCAVRAKFAGLPVRTGKDVD
ncbi:P-loop containing nucleoside triphosphate hydrolase protein, partial [Suillus ampliporus]